jgi:hypothetical protein
MISLIRINWDREPASYPDMQKIRIIGFFLKIGDNGSLKFGCCY